MDKQLKVGIVGGLISSLLVLIFIQPILNFLWRLILNAGGILHQGYVDRIYKDAARAGGNPYGESTLLALGLVFGFVGLFWILDRMRASPASGSFPQLSRSADRAVLFVLMAGLLSILFRVAISRGTADIAESFTQRLTVLASGISDSEYKILKARWASMHGRADYDAIVADMEKCATELGVKLPPVR